MNELALFAGAGGGLLGSRLLGWRTVGAVELDPYCREVLLRRQRDGMLDLFPVWDNIKTFRGGPWRGKVDILTAGFPCQPFSVAGQRKGEGDDRNLWPDTIRVVREVGPRYVFLENVPGLLAHDYFGSILGDLAESGFDAEWGVLSAAAVGAPHLRKRLWIIAYPSASQCNAGTERAGRKAWPDASGGGPKTEVADTSGQRCGPAGNTGPRTQTGTGPSAKPSGPSWWAVEPDVGRVAHGVAHRVDRLRALGNGQVPLVAAEAWLRLIART